MLTELTTAEARAITGGIDPVAVIVEGVKTAGNNLALVANAVIGLFGF